MFKARYNISLKLHKLCLKSTAELQSKKKKKWLSLNILSSKKEIIKRTVSEINENKWTYIWDE